MPAQHLLAHKGHEYRTVLSALTMRLWRKVQFSCIRDEVSKTLLGVFIFMGFLNLQILIFRAALGLWQNWRENRDFPYPLCPPHISPPSTIVTIPHQSVSMRNLRCCLCWHIVITQSPQFTSGTLGVIHSIGLDKWTMTCPQYPSIIQFYCFKKSSVLAYFSLLPPIFIFQRKFLCRSNINTGEAALFRGTTKLHFLSLFHWPLSYCHQCWEQKKQFQNYFLVGWGKGNVF